MKTRIIQTRFWDDDIVMSMSRNAKYLWLFLLTNKEVGMSNYVHIPDSFIEIYTKLTPKELADAKSELEATKKLRFYQNWIFIANLERENNYKNSPKNEPAYDRELSQVPTHIKDYFSNSDSTIDTSIDSSIDTTHKSEIRNHKSEIINKQEFSKKYFKENWEQILAECKAEFSDNSLYEDKDFDRVMQEFLEGIEIKDYKYKNYRLAYLKWLRNSNHTVNQRLIGTKTKLAIN